MSRNLKSFSQNQEDLFVLNYFKDYKGIVLEIGANNGTDLSNSKLLIEQGFSAHLVEPGAVFKQLFELHKGNDKVVCHNFGIGICTPGGVKLPFYESAAHILGGNDVGLVSSGHYSETLRWRKAGVEFNETVIQIFNFDDFWAMTGNSKFDYVSIDAEGFDKEILSQIDLGKVGCSCLCIEWNSDPDLSEYFIAYCAKFDMHPRLINNENIIFTK